MELKLDRDIDWHDLPEIESPFLATRLVEYGDPCGERIEGIEIFDYSRSLSRKDQLREIIESLENGYIYLLRNFPDSPVFRWVKTGRDNGYWERTGSYGHFFDMSADYMLKDVVRDHYHFLDTWRKVRGNAVEEPTMPVMPVKSNPYPTAEETNDWIGVELLDEEGNPAVDQMVTIKTRDGVEHNLTTDSNGIAQIKNFKIGNAEIIWPEIDEIDFVS